MSDKAGQERLPQTAAELRAARLRYFMPGSAQAEPEHEKNVVPKIRGGV